MLKRIFYLLLFVSTISESVNAQVTTSSISGVVTSQSGDALVGATITATHLPTGSKYTTTTRAGGQFDISNMNPGGPYTIAVSYVGMETQTRNDIYLVLGESSRQDFNISATNTELATVVVASTTRATAKNGSETNINRERLANVPTVGRNLNDFVRLTPQARITANGGISLGGQNNRYNSFMIDGAVNNDVFGVSETGTNGGRAGVPPISIDAVDQIVVQLSPFDASVGNFTGGGINAITKSGTNAYHGSAYYIFRNQNFAGKTPGVPDSLRIKLADFKNQTYGFTIGGPIIKNKAFFFVNVEKQNDNRPQPYTPINPATGYRIADTIAKLVNYLKTTYNYDPGDYLNNPDKIDRTNINTRFDWNVTDLNKLTLSYRLTKAERYNPGRSSNNAIQFTNGAEYFPSTTHSGNAELNTKFSNKANNKIRLSFTDVVDDRDITGTPFPRVVINSFNGGPSLNFGSETASAANLLKQRVINVYDAFKYFTGDHSFTFGADLDFNSSYNLFINRSYGEYTYSNLGSGATQINALQAFIENRGPSRYRRGYSLVDAGNKGGDANVNSAANFKSVRAGFFANDDIKVTNAFTLTLGLRADKTSFLSDLPIDTFFRDSASKTIATVYDLQGAESGQKFRPSWQFSPRVGFRYNIEEQKLVVRGGIGVFAGRTPLVWPGGVYQNTGVTIGGVDTSSNAGLKIGTQPVQFHPGVNNQYTQLDFGLSPSLLFPQGDLNLIVRNFKLPSVYKVSLAFDKRFGTGWTFTLDGLFTKNINEVDWLNVNILPPAIQTSGPDKRTIYSTGGSPARFVFRPQSSVPAARNPYSNIILIQNTQGRKGYAYNFTAIIDKQTRTGFNFNASYTYGSSMVNNEATSSVNTSNWQFGAETVTGRNFVTLSNSDYDLGHRIFAFVSKRFSYAQKRFATTVSLVYNGQSGNPYSYTYGNRQFVGDGVSGNDLIYIPRDRAEMDQMVFTQSGTLTPTQQKDDFEKFIQGDKYLSKRRGQFAERNGVRLPFTNIVDLNVQQDFSLKVGTVNHNLTVRVDIANFTNLLNKDWGRQYFLTNDMFQLVSFEGFVNTPAPNTPTYRFFKPAGDRVGTISDGVNVFNSSRWNAQLTVRYSF